jgi:hypothetical protein
VEKQIAYDVLESKNKLIMDCGKNNNFEGKVYVFSGTRRKFIYFLTF